MTIAAQSTPWYREPWPWILMAGPAVVIVAGVVTVWLAVTSYDGLVVDDYYKRGLAINQTLARSAAASALGLEGDLAIDSQSGAVTLVLRGAADAGSPQSLRLTVAHATRAGSDQSISLARAANGAFVARIDPLTPGRWQLVVEEPDGKWRIKGGLQAPQEHNARVSP